MSLQDSHCIVCGARLTLHQRARSQICEGWRCREQTLAQALEAHRAVAAAALGIEQPDEHVLFLVPRYERPVVELPARRIRKFRAHWRRAAPEGPAELAVGEGGHRALPEAETKRLGQACTACRGYCCRYGRLHAFLGGVHLARYLAAHPDETPGQAVEVYLGHLPEQSFEGACVYQDRDGCTLPRALRADLCNAYLCAGWRAYRRALERRGPKPGCAVAREDNRIARSAFFDAEQLRCYEPAAHTASPTATTGHPAKDT
jgi:hypothetical protein